MALLFSSLFYFCNISLKRVVNYIELWRRKIYKNEEVVTVENILGMCYARRTLSIK